jgi:hypothetical protein
MEWDRRVLHPLSGFIPSFSHEECPGTCRGVFVFGGLVVRSPLDHLAKPQAHQRRSASRRRRPRRAGAGLVAESDSGPADDFGDTALLELRKYCPGETLPGR